MPNPEPGRVTILVVAALSDGAGRLLKAIAEEGWQAAVAADVKDALQTLGSHVVDVVVFDGAAASMEDACTAICQFVAIQPDTPVILTTAFGISGERVEALRAGAFQVLSEAAGEGELIFTLGRALAQCHLARQHRNLRQQMFLDSQRTNLLGDGPAIAEIRRQLAACAGGRSPVLIEGEPGTGKELAARILHFAGPREEQPLVTVRCSAPCELLEAELFGHMPSGSEPRRGALEEAAGGTLHLDDVGRMDETVQVRLLGVLSANSSGPESSRRAIPLHVRIVATSSANLDDLVRKGRFSSELRDLLCATEIHMPPLRARAEDIEALAGHFLERWEKRSGKHCDLSAEALLMLQLHDWPGNVDELKDAIERASERNSGGVLKPEHFPREVRGGLRHGERAEDFFAGLPSLEGLTRRYTSYVVQSARGNRDEAAAILGVSRDELDHLAARLGRQATRRKIISAPSAGSDMLEGKV